jgi:hypothetical protein
LEGITAKETRLHDPPAAPQLLFVDGFADKAWHCDKTMPNAAQSIFFANYKPAFGWVIASFCLLMAIVLSFIVYRDGPPTGYSPLSVSIILVFLWAFVLGGAAYAFHFPCVVVCITSDNRLRIVLQYPFSRQTNDMPPSAVKQISIIETKDSEGDPYFLARISIDHKLSFDFCESHNRLDCEGNCETLRALLKEATPNPQGSD